ncbi:MAG TPA: J domain-containing protein [Blastocatellia bacterium]|nr:J domain-containing protein [Blastocatellia bacterium]
MNYSADQLKHKLRELKKLEIRVRFKGQPAGQNRRLVWDAFFSTKAEDQASVKYPLARLLGLDHHGMKEVFEEYFYRIYFQSWQESGLTTADVHNPELLSLLGLPPYAEAREIKSRFRELAKKYHPDLGGDSDRFIELMSIYERLTKDS